MTTTARTRDASTARLVHQYSHSHMAAPAAAMGTSGTLMPLARKARAISHKPMPMATPMKMRKVALTVNNVATTSAAEQHADPRRDREVASRRSGLGCLGLGRTARG